MASSAETFLTPRSKVAKMLADIDDEIEHAPTPSPSRSLPSKPLNADVNISSTVEVLDAVYTARQSSPKISVQNAPSHSDSDSEGSDEAMRKPQGRAARRMLGVASSPQISPIRPGTVEDDEEDLYSATPRDAAKVRALATSPTGSERGNGLFVSPAKSLGNESDDDLPSHPLGLGSNVKLSELVAQKRAERLARAAEEDERGEKDMLSSLPDEELEDSNDTTNDLDIDKIMSDATRPSRKASKKALLEMERETQRMSRQQALAHQMKVKKKFTTNDLLSRFNLGQSETVKDAPINDSTKGGDVASSVPNSDETAERARDPRSTPPSSPPTPFDRQKALVEYGALSKLVPVRQDSLASLVQIDEDEDLPDIDEIMRSSRMGKSEEPALIRLSPRDKKGLKLARLGKKANLRRDDGSDGELEIVDQLPTHLRAFDKAAGSTRPGRPAESRAIHNLKHLSHLNTHEAQPLKKGARPSLTPKALESQLRRRAKEQARQQQMERIEELRAKGIEVQTAEEQEKEAEAFENLLEKARHDAVELRKAEKAALKEAGGEGVAQISDDEDEDDDYVGSESEDEDMEGAEHEKEGEGNELIDEAAEETDGGEGEEAEHDQDKATDMEDDDEATQSVAEEEPALGTDLGFKPHTASRKSRKSRIVFDDEDEDDQEGAEHGGDMSVADLVAEDEDPFAAFHFGGANNGDALMSPTQAFNATMQTPTQLTQENSLDLLRRIAPPSMSSLPPSLPDLDTQVDEETQPSFAAGSQVPESQRISLDWETQPPETPVQAAVNREGLALSETPGWEPTQDPGLPSPWSVAPKMRRENTLDSIAEFDTQSTVRLRVSESPAPSQIATKRGKLGHRRVPLLDDSDDELAAPATSVKPEQRDAFREMAQRRKEALTAAERAEAEREMRQMMDEQAEESEDEYAGLGGDDFVAPENEEDREMIDSSHVDVDERALAAHFADRQRQQDEAETSKLYKDLTTGVLRRKTGANAFDLDEDEDELAVRRRQMRQREEAKKRRALLKDENIATLAEGRQSKGKDAFLKAIADDDGDDEMVNLSDGGEESVSATQEESRLSQSQQVEPDPLRETSGNKRKLDEGAESSNERPPAKQRRTQTSAFRRPTSLLEVQESVSFLLEEPNAAAVFGPSPVELNSNSEDEEDEKTLSDVSDGDDEVAAEQTRQNHGGFAPNPTSMEEKAMPPPRLPAAQRRTAAKPEVVDRLSLKRGSSTSSGALGRTAWAAGPTTGGFKVPSLLRRATTSLASTTNDRGVTTPSLSRENSGVKMGGSKKSSLAYQARAEERRAIVEASAKRREENTAKIAQLRRNSSALSKGLTGRFE